MTSDPLLTLLASLPCESSASPGGGDITPSSSSSSATSASSTPPSPPSASGVSTAMGRLNGGPSTPSTALPCETPVKSQPSLGSALELSGGGSAGTLFVLGSGDKKRGKWSALEDSQLRAAVLDHKGKNWKNIAKAAFGDSKSDVQCLHRWQKVLDPKLVKGPWTKEVLTQHNTTTQHKEGRKRSGCEGESSGGID